MDDGVPRVPSDKRHTLTETVLRGDCFAIPSTFYSALSPERAGPVHNTALWNVAGTFHGQDRDRARFTACSLIEQRKRSFLVFSCVGGEIFYILNAYLKDSLEKE